MKITWLGHACFKVEKEGTTIVFDPYADGSVPGLKSVRETADLVFCSHEHGDHNGRSCVTLTGKNADVFTVETIDTYHDEAKGTKRGPNRIHIVSDGVQKIAHMGDIGCELEAEQKELLKDLDVMMIPVGGFFTIDAAQAAALVREVEPKHVIPMHFRSDADGFGYDIIGTVDAFTSIMDSVKMQQDSVYDTESDTEEQVIVLKPQNV